MTAEFVILDYFFEIKSEKQDKDLQENIISIPSILLYVVKKYHKDTIMGISWFFCKYTCIMSWNKGERARIGRIVKEITFLYGEWMQ